MDTDSSNTTSFRRIDIIEILIGGSIMAFPAATTEEIWNLGADLSLQHCLLFSFASLFFLGVLIRGIHGSTMSSRKAFVDRVLATYMITFLVGAAILFGVDKLDLLSDPLTGLKRAILVAFPASFAATAVDGIGFQRN